MNAKKIPGFRWENATYDVRRVAARDKEAFVAEVESDKDKKSRALLHDKCTAMVADADKPEAEDKTAEGAAGSKSKRKKADTPTI